MVKSEYFVSMNFLTEFIWAFRETYEDDICLVKVSPPFSYNQYVKPFAVPTTHYVASGMYNMRQDNYELSERKKFKRFSSIQIR